MPDYNLPEIIATPLALHQHIQSQFQNLQGHDRGNPWQEFSKKIIPLTEYGKLFPYLKDNKRKTRDEGWDIMGTGNEDKDAVLYIQAKYHVNDKNDLDGVVNCWAALAGLPSGMLPLEISSLMNSKRYFALVTMSDLTQILQIYLKSSRPGAVTLQHWLDEGKVLILDMNKIWSVIKEGYLKTYSMPRTQDLQFASQCIQFGNVLVGVLPANEIKRIYQETGDAIFFDNVRDFAGETDVNAEIAKTVVERPAQFLQLNNGIVFSTSRVETIGENKVRLYDASIINGCQTTVSLASTEVARDAHVLVKVVQTDKSEDRSAVTHAANFQNQIFRIDLDLARYIRPQVVKKMGYALGIPVSSANVSDILDTFNKQKMTWRNIRILFIGLFSQDPGNMFDVQWDRVKSNLLKYFFDDEERINEVFEVVFNLHLMGEKGAEHVKKAFAGLPEMLSLFGRLLGDTTSPYMQFLVILATCAVVNVNIADEPGDLNTQIHRMQQLLKAFKDTFDNKEADLMDAYVAAFNAVAHDGMDNTGDDEEIRRKMFRRITTKNKFSLLYKSTQLNLYTNRAIQKNSES